MKKFSLLFALVVLILLAPFGSACGPFKGFFQRFQQKPQQFQQQPCEPVQQQAQMQYVPVPQQMPQTAPKAEQPKTKIVWQQQCRGGVCVMVPVAVTDDASEQVVSAISWDF